MDDEEFDRKVRELKPYDETDDADSSVENKYLGAVKVRLPRRSRVLVGYALIAFIAACSIAVIIAAWKL